MKLATWNINSIRARQERFFGWLAQHRPDVLCLQETKVEDGGFPSEELRAAGYQAALFGQRSYNGVAICARQPLEDIARGMDDGDPDDQARLIAATVNGLRVLSVYVPNGQSPGSDKYSYKLRWLERLRAHLDARYRGVAALVVAGDWNVAPADLDVHDPAIWREQIMCTTDERAALSRVQAFGLSDAFRHLHPDAQEFTWWDYRQLAFPRKKGLRIDHALVSPSVVARLRGAEIDREARKGKLPSDHAPLIVTID